MTPKQVKENIGKVVEWDGKLWFLLSTVQSKGYFNLLKRARMHVVLGARGEKHEVLPQKIKLADYPGQRPGD